MKKQKHRIFGLLLVLIIGAVLMGGCTQNSTDQKTTTQPQDTIKTTTLQSQVTVNPQSPIKVTGLKTCAALSGHVCGAGSECDGTWLDASDTFSCCSKKCRSGVTDVTEGEILSIDSFEISPENEDLGEVI